MTSLSSFSFLSMVGVCKTTFQHSDQDANIDVVPHQHPPGTLLDYELKWNYLCQTQTKWR